MIPGMKCLLEVLREESSARIVGETEWELAIALADEHRVLPFVAERLLTRELPLPPALQARLLQAKRQALHYSFLQSSELQQLLQAFADSKIPVLPLKGPSLAKRVYGAASLRISCDLDLLVHQADFARATLVVQTLGFAPDTMPDDYHGKWSRGTTIVELHFDVENPLAIDFDTQGAWKNARQADFAGQPAWQFAPQDELRYLCLHGVRHRFARLSLILDIALASKQLGHPHDLQRRRPRRLDQTGSFVVLGCALARRLHLERAETPGPPTTCQSDSGMKRLADRLWSDLLTKPPAEQDWASLHGFYLETEPTRFRRLIRRFLHLRILLTRLIDDDFRFAAQFGLKRRWQVWLLRPARLALRRRNASISAPQT